MGLIRRHLDPTSRSTGLALAAGVPLACYLWTASAYGYWLDGGEFVAASITLGISHPPGHPLAALLGRALALLPVGPLALRVAVASALLAAVAAGALFLAIDATVRSAGLERDSATVPLSVGAVWLVAGSHGFWFQAVRPEVYALQAALSCLLLERVVALEAAWPTRDLRPLLGAALVLGLGLANHHFLAILLLPVLMPTAARALRAGHYRACALSAALLALGMAAYAYLPLRAAGQVLPNLGSPSTPARLWWVVSAQAFQKNTGAGVPQPLWERYVDVAVTLGENLNVACLIAVAGLYVLLRMPGARRIGIVWALAVALPWAGRAWLGFVRSNPDAEGYLLPAFAAVGALFAAFVARLLSVQARTRTAPRVAVAVSAVALVLGSAQLYRGVDSASLQDFDATDDLQQGLRRTLPARAVVLAHAPQTLFALWGGQGEEALRPDLTVVPVPFLAYPGMIASLASRAPELRELLRGYALHGEWRQPDLQSAAARRPLLVEMDMRAPRALYETLIPERLYYEVSPAGATRTDQQLGAREQDRFYRGLYRQLGQPSELDPRTRHVMLWRHFNDALYRMRVGDLDAARRAVDRAAAIEPRSAPLPAMRAALERAGDDDEPIDIRPFLGAVQGGGRRR